MTFLSILALGFFLGMRHATDSDHVVAVTTIVGRQREIGSAALTGIFWGIGHSITLLVVGGAIIIFGIVIPERLGMSLEFCVALMLILLGWLNLRAFKRSVADVASIDHLVHEHVHQHGDYIHRHCACT
jgi:high-affinity nickel-transport protein